MLSASEQKLAGQIFWILLIISAVCTLGSYVAAGAIAVYAVQAAVMYTRIAREDWRYTAGLKAQFISSQKYYWLYLRRIFTPAAADEDQQYLDAYGGSQSIRQWLFEWGKRLLRGFAALLIWLPAMVIHAGFLGAASLRCGDESTSF